MYIQETNCIIGPSVIQVDKKHRGVQRRETWVWVGEGTGRWS